MTGPIEPVVQRPMPRLGNGVVWSEVARAIDEGELVPPLPGWAAPHVLAAPEAPSGPVPAVPALDLGEDAPTPSSARAYEGDALLHPGEIRYLLGRDAPVPAPPARRGWLLRAIEGIFG